MNWIEGLQASLNYIEAHLEEELNPAALTQFTQQSYSYYQRLFHMTTGLSPAAYIRNRRMSKAGEVLRREKGSILEVALRFQYETAESFTKAFKRFHGITPTQAKITQLPLRTFTPLHLELRQWGASSLSYRLMSLPAFTIQGYRQIFKTQQSDYHREIPNFWQQFFQDPLYAHFLEMRTCDNATKGGILGIDTMAMDKDEECFQYYAGIQSDHMIIHPKVTSFQIRAHEWIIFTCVGNMPEAIQRLWLQIYGEFFPHDVYTPCLDYHMECYFPEQMEHAEIWIPVQIKGA